MEVAGQSVDMCEGWRLIGDQYGLFLTSVIMSRLSHDIRPEWSRKGSSNKSDLAWLLHFLQRKIEHSERSDSFKDVATAGRSDGRSAGEAERKVSPGSASALQTFSEVSQTRRGFCNKSHASEEWFIVFRLSAAERSETICSAELYFKCLRKVYISEVFISNCSKFKGSHNRLFYLILDYVAKGSEETSISPSTKESEIVAGNVIEKPAELVVYFTVLLSSAFP